MPELALHGAGRPVEVDRLVDQADPSARIAAEQPQRVVVLRPGEGEGRPRITLRIGTR